MPSPSKRKPTGNRAAAAKPPKPGEQTTAQVQKSNDVFSFLRAASGNAFGTGEGVRGFSPPPPGTFPIYRDICKYPTVAIGLQKIVGPIADAPVSWEKRDDAPDEWVEFISGMFDPMMSQVLETAMLAVRYGFSPFEKVWAEKDGKFVIDQLKPLLVDATEYLYDEKGRLKGLRNKPSNGDAVDLLWNKCFAFTLAGEAGNPYGTSRLENIRKRWAEVEQIIERFARYLAKVAAVIGQIHYPDGQSLDASGSQRPNQWIAAQIAADAAAGRWLCIPNKFASFLSPDNAGMVTPAVMEKALAAAGKSEWVVSFLDPGGTDFAPGYTAALEYYDKQLLRGLYIPERSVIEGQHGTKADAGTHDEMTVLDASGLYRKFVRAFNANVVDEVLVYNFGEAARGGVYAEAPPLSDENGATRLSTLTAMLNSSDPAVVRATARKIDLVSLLEDEEIPVVEGEEKSTLADAIDAAMVQEKADKDQAAKAAADALKLKAQQPAVAPPAKGKGGGATAKMLSRWVEGETLPVLTMSNAPKVENEPKTKEKAAVANAVPSDTSVEIPAEKPEAKPDTGRVDSRVERP